MEFLSPGLGSSWFSGNRIPDKFSVWIYINSQVLKNQGFENFELSTIYMSQEKLISLHANYKQSDQPTRPHSAVGNVSGCRYMSDCRSRGREFDLGPVSYFKEIGH